MKFQAASAIFSIAVLVTLQGCTTLSGTTRTPDPVAASNIPAANPLLDHYIAWIPRDRAQTATVAEAMTHISLVNAMEQTARQLCGGNWVMNGTATTNVGPLPATAPEAAGGYSAWYYRISHRPGLHGCPGTDSQTLYLTLQKHLPDWVDVKAARTTTLSLLE